MNIPAKDESTVAPQVNPAEVDERVRSGTLVIDVREPEDHAKANVPGSVNISLSVLTEKVASAIPDKDAPVICYCNGGSRGPRAAVELQRMGYTNVASIDGGLRAYLALKDAS